MKTCHFGEKLQSRELNLVLRTTETDCQTGTVSKKVVFVKVLPDFKVFLGNHVYYYFTANMFSINRYYNKVRNRKK